MPFMGGLLAGSEGNLIVLGSGGDILFRGRGIAVFAAQEFELPRPDLHEAVVQTLAVLPGSLLQLTTDADLGTLGAVFADDLRQALEGRHPKPVDLFDLLAVLPLVNFVDRNGETGDGNAARGVVG